MPDGGPPAAGGPLGLTKPIMIMIMIMMQVQQYVNDNDNYYDNDDDAGPAACHDWASTNPLLVTAKPNQCRCAISLS